MKQIAFITDIHLDEQFPMDHGIRTRENWIRTIEDLEKKGIQHVIFGGDIGEPSTHPWFFETLRPFSLDLILGNHDRYEQVAKHYKKGNDLKELFYSVEEDSFKFIFLDTSSDYLSNTQLQWLKSELDTLKKVTIFMHHPVLAIDTPVDRIFPLKNRAEVLAILLASGKQIIIFCSHYHMNKEYTYKNITQIITQSLSYQLTEQADDIEVNTSTFGYRLITLQKENILTQCIYFKNKLEVR